MPPPPSKKLTLVVPATPRLTRFGRVPPWSVARVTANALTKPQSPFETSVAVSFSTTPKVSESPSAM